MGKEPFETDFFERYLVEKCSDDIHTLLEGCSYDVSVIPALVDAIGEKPDKTYNAVLLIKW